MSNSPYGVTVVPWIYMYRCLTEVSGGTSRLVGLGVTFNTVHCIGLIERATMWRASGGPVANGPRTFRSLGRPFNYFGAGIRVLNLQRPSGSRRGSNIVSDHRKWFLLTKFKTEFQGEEESVDALVLTWNVHAGWLAVLTGEGVDLVMLGEEVSSDELSIVVTSLTQSALLLQGSKGVGTARAVLRMMLVSGNNIQLVILEFRIQVRWILVDLDGWHSGRTVVNSGWCSVWMLISLVGFSPLV